MIKKTDQTKPDAVAGFHYTQSSLCSAGCKNQNVLFFQKGQQLCRKVLKSDFCRKTSLLQKIRLTVGSHVGRGMGWEGTRFSGPCGTAMGQKSLHKCWTVEMTKMRKIRTLFTCIGSTIALIVYDVTPSKWKWYHWIHIALNSIKIHVSRHRNGILVLLSTMHMSKCWLFVGHRGTIFCLWVVLDGTGWDGTASLWDGMVRPKSRLHGKPAEIVALKKRFQKHCFFKICLKFFRLEKPFSTWIWGAPDSTSAALSNNTRFGGNLTRN